MPIYFHKNKPDFQLGIWKINESLEELLSMLKLNNTELATFNSFKSGYRKREWLTTRVLVKKLIADPENSMIVYDPNGKPRLHNSEFSISISHTKDFVSVLLAKYVSAGIDLETIQPRIEKISNRFISAEEEMPYDENNKLDYMHVIWGAKEVLFKIYGKGELNFLENLFTEKFQLKEKGELKGRITKSGFKKVFQINYEKLENLMLVYAMCN